MKKAGCLMMVLAVLILVGGFALGFFSGKNIVEKLQEGEVDAISLKAGDQQRFGPVEVEPGQELSVIFRGSDYTGAFDAELDIRITDGEGVTIVEGRYEVDQSMFQQKMAPSDVMDQTQGLGLLIPIEDFTAPASGKIEVSVETARSSNLSNVTDPRLSINRFDFEGIAKSAMGAAGGVVGGVCLGAVVGLIGLILLIVGLVRGGKNKQQPLYEQPGQQTPYQQ